MNNTRDMTLGRPGRLLFSFALPLMFGNICQQLYMVADTAIVGRGVGLNALAALGCVDWFNWMLFGIAQGLSHGFSVLMAQKFGEKDLPGLRRTVAQSALLALAVALSFIVLFQAALPLILYLLQVPGELRPLSALKWLAAATLVCLVFLYGQNARVYHQRLDYAQEQAARGAQELTLPLLPHVDWVSNEFVGKGDICYLVYREKPWDVKVDFVYYSKWSGTW